MKGLSEMDYHYQSGSNSNSGFLYRDKKKKTANPAVDPGLCVI